MEGLPKPRVKFQGITKSGKMDVVLFFLNFFPACGGIQDLDAKLNPGLCGFFFQNGQHVL